MDILCMVLANGLRNNGRHVFPEADSDAADALPVLVRLCCAFACLTVLLDALGWIGPV